MRCVQLCLTVLYFQKKRTITNVSNLPPRLKQSIFKVKWFSIVVAYIERSNVESGVLRRTIHTNWRWLVCSQYNTTHSVTLHSYITLIRGRDRGMIQEPLTSPFPLYNARPDVCRDIPSTPWFQIIRIFKS